MGGTVNGDIETNSEPPLGNFYKIGMDNQSARVTSIKLVMLAEIYLRKNIVYLPTMARTEAGIYSGIDPVTVVPVTDAGAFTVAIRETMARGNPIIPTPKRDSWPEPVVLKYAKVKSWTAFEKDASIWTVEEKAGIYHISPGRRHPDGGWEDDPVRIETFPKGATIDDVARRVVALVQSS